MIKRSQSMDANGNEARENAAENMVFLSSPLLHLKTSTNDNGDRMNFDREEYVERNEALKKLKKKMLETQLIPNGQKSKTNSGNKGSSDNGRIDTSTPLDSMSIKSIDHEDK